MGVCLDLHSNKLRDGYEIVFYRMTLQSHRRFKRHATAYCSRLPHFIKFEIESNVRFSLQGTRRSAFI